MYLPRSSCIICGEHINKLQYNLKTTFTEKSKVLLINLIERLYKNVLFLHCNICTACYDVLNELDGIRQRQKELLTTLKQNISRIDKSNLDTSVSSDNEDDSFAFNYTDSAKDSAHSSSSPSKINTNIGEQLKKEYSSEEEIKVDDIDFKKLPITIRRVKVEINETNMNDLEIPDKAKEEIDENNKLFGMIQSSIRRELSMRMIEHSNKEKPSKNFLCEVCGISFRNQIGYSNHLKKHEGIEDEMKLLALNKVNNMWLCNVCGKSFRLKSALKRHSPIHTGISRYQCDQCGKKFMHQSSFRMHLKIHANQRDAICEICQRAFLSRSHLKRHLRTAHKKNPEKTYSCEICDRKFVEQYNLNAHLKLHVSKNLRVTEIEDPLAIEDPAVNEALQLDKPMENQSVIEMVNEVVVNTTDEVVADGDLTIYNMQNPLGNDDGLLKIHEPTTGMTYTIMCNNLY